MSAAKPKEPQPLGSTSGKRGYIRTCVRCGVTLVALIAWCAALTIAPFALIKLCMAILAA